MTVAPLATEHRHLIALDLDGTVLDNHHPEADGYPVSGHVDPALGRAIRTLHEAGHEVVIATGRSVDATLPVIEKLGIRPDWAIAANGAITLKRDPLAGRAYRHEIVEAFDPSEALKRIRTRLTTSARFALELADGEFLYTQEIPTATLPANQRKVAFEDLLGVQATRVVVISPDENTEEFLDVVGTLGLTHTSYTAGTAVWCDIAPHGVTKASALEVVAERIGIDRSHVFAAGDGRNDIDMLTWAARRGDAVAMGQALDEVQQVASRVTDTVERGGLLSALQERFPALLG